MIRSFSDFGNPEIPYKDPFGLFSLSRLSPPRSMSWAITALSIFAQAFWSHFIIPTPQKDVLPQRQKGNGQEAKGGPFPEIGLQGHLRLKRRNLNSPPKKRDCHASFGRSQ